MDLWTAKERNQAGNEANLAFGAACLAVRDITSEAANKAQLPEGARLLLDEMAFSQNQLLDLFSAGAHAAVCELALSIVVLADRISMLIE
jgi:hypothetical protein